MGGTGTTKKANLVGGGEQPPPSDLDLLDPLGFF